MQLDPARSTPSLRARLGAAACTLLATSLPSAAHAAADPRWLLETSALYYGEQARTQIAEPVIRVTRVFSDRRTIALGFTYDAMTGASPTGAQPSGTIQTTTTPSGSVMSSGVNVVPLSPFHDHRVAFDLGVQQPIGRPLLLGGSFHFSQERDYQSVGGSGTLSADLFSRSLTVSAGGGYDGDHVKPQGGFHEGLTADSILADVSEAPKHVSHGMVGFSRVLSRRWLLGVNGSRSKESGYLTDPYKVISLIDPASDSVVGQVSEKRPDTRDRKDVMASSTYHLEKDVFYSSYRYYWDDWGIRSHTIDLKLRHELDNGNYIQPHFRFYTQSAADFFVYGLDPGTPLPTHASADYRLASLQTYTYGLKYGIPLPGNARELGIRVEYMHQPGHGDRSSGEGSGGGGEDDGGGAPVTPSTNVLPHLNAFTVLVGYTTHF
jgi:uncharacterized protein DUF3570